MRRVLAWLQKKWKAIAGWFAVTFAFVWVIIRIRGDKAEKSNNDYVDKTLDVQRTQDAMVEEVADEARAAAEESHRGEVIRVAKEAAPLERARDAAEVADEINDLLGLK